MQMENVTTMRLNELSPNLTPEELRELETAEAGGSLIQRHNVLADKIHFLSPVFASP